MDAWCLTSTTHSLYIVCIPDILLPCKHSLYTVWMIDVLLLSSHSLTTVWMPDILLPSGHSIHVSTFILKSHVNPRNIIIKLNTYLIQKFLMGLSHLGYFPFYFSFGSVFVLYLFHLILSAER